MTWRQMWVHHWSQSWVQKQTTPSLSTPSTPTWSETLWKSPFRQVSTKTHVCNTTAKCTQLKCNIYKFLLLNAYFRFFIFGKVCNNVWEYVRNLIYTNLILQYYVYLYYISVPFPFSSSSFTSGVQFPCYWGGIVFPASWLDSSTRET